MINYRFIFYSLGILLLILAVVMLIPTFTDMSISTPNWRSFIFSAFLTAFIGLGLTLTNQGKYGKPSLKPLFALTVAASFILPLFAGLPFYFSDDEPGLLNAYFEATAGLTTTNVTTFYELDRSSPGILIWRSLLQWLGGMIALVLAVIILPALKIGGMQIFRSATLDGFDKIAPRIQHIVITIGSIYALLTILCAICLWLAGMNQFDAICHAMTTLSSGGFSTHNDSILFFDSIAIEIVLSLFMVISILPYVFYLKKLYGHKQSLWHDSQVRWFMHILFLSIATMTLWLVVDQEIPLGHALRHSVFNITSVLTTTGFASINYAEWGSFAVMLFFLLSAVGGCAGSTSGGIKIFRLQVLYQTASIHIQHLIRPHCVLRAKINQNSLEDRNINSIMAFFILFSCCFAVLSIALSAFGFDLLSGLTTAASILSNQGAGLGMMGGPMSNYATISDPAKIAIIAGMLVARLEMFLFFVLLTPLFWRS